MPKRPLVPTVDKIGPDTPLRLEIAAAVAFPDGSMTVRGLQKERDKGRLTVERIAGKDYTTLAAFDEMRRLCRFTPKQPLRAAERPDPSVPQQALLQRLQRRKEEEHALRKAEREIGQKPRREQNAVESPSSRLDGLGRVIHRYAGTLLGFASAK